MKNSTFDQRKTGKKDGMSKEFKAKHFIFIAQARDGAGESFYLYGRLLKKKKERKKNLFCN